MRNIKLTLEYDGTNYVGWQFQNNGPSIQAELEKALSRILRERVQVIGAGRTDSGVHARGQVCNFRTHNEVEARSLVKGLNALVPQDIAVLDAKDVDSSFHARRSAKGRVYRYVLSLEPTAFERNYAWFVGGFHLNVTMMKECAKLIAGDHDFTSFCKAETELRQHRCVIEIAEWRQDDRRMIFEIGANRFLHGMVRALVGTMVEIGRGRGSLEEFSRILDAKDRRAAGMAAPAKGLFLEKIIY